MATSTSRTGSSSVVCISSQPADRSRHSCQPVPAPSATRTSRCDQRPPSSTAPSSSGTGPSGGTPMPGSASSRPPSRVTTTPRWVRGARPGRRPGRAAGGVVPEREQDGVEQGGVLEAVAAPPARHELLDHGRERHPRVLLEEHVDVVEREGPDVGCEQLLQRRRRGWCGRGAGAGEVGVDVEPGRGRAHPRMVAAGRTDRVKRATPRPRPSRAYTRPTIGTAREGTLMGLVTDVRLRQPRRTTWSATGSWSPGSAPASRDDRHPGPRAARQGRRRGLRPVQRRRHRRRRLLGAGAGDRPAATGDPADGAGLRRQPRPARPGPVARVRPARGRGDLLPGSRGFLLYRVESGDTLTGIVRKLKDFTKVTVKQVVAANPRIEDPDVIVTGWRLRIPLQD